MASLKGINYTKKWYKGHIGAYMSESSLQQCKIGLRAVESGLITAIQLDVCRIILKRAGSQRAKIFILPSVDRSITKKTVGTRIGKGKGDFSYWATYVQAGQILIEVEGVSLTTLVEVATKIPIRTRVSRKIIPI